MKTKAGAQETDGGSRPAELSQVLQTLRQLRPSSSALEGKDTEHNDARDSQTGSDGDHETGTVDGSIEEDLRISAIEERLKHYIDDKFEQLERKLEKRLQDLFSSQCYHNSRLLHIAQDENLD